MSTIIYRAGWVVAAALALFVVAALTGVVSGGPLDPPGTPGPTGKTLEEIPGSWSRKLLATDGAPGPVPPKGCNSTRFQCTEIGTLDRETGLVWFSDAQCCSKAIWLNARGNCTQIEAAGRQGWRLPTIEEIKSLVELFVGTPALPPGSPFTVYTDDHYWTATSLSSTTAYAYRFDQNQIVDPKSEANYVWCVRGGPGYDLVTP